MILGVKMITAEELKKLNDLKEKGVITEEEFNQKREEYLNNSTDISEVSSSGINPWIIFIGVFILLTSLSNMITGNNPNQICGVYWGDRYRPSTLAFLDDIEIEFSNSDIGWEWSKYDQQKICISGNVIKKNYIVGNQAPYIVYNPRFAGYAN